MTCAELDQRAVDYLYGELTAADRAVVDAHLGGCDDCRRELRALERALGVTREALRGPLAHEAPSRVRVALEQEAARVAAQAAARRPREGAGLWDWLRRPWFLPAVASFAVVTIFVLAKPAIVDKPRQAMQQAEEEARSRAEELKSVPAAEPAVAPVPAAAPPAAPESESSAPALGAASERSAEKKVSAPRPQGVAGIRGAGGGVLDEERAKRADTPARRYAATRPAASRWATPPPTAPPPAAAPRGRVPAAPVRSPTSRWLRRRRSRGTTIWPGNARPRARRAARRAAHRPGGWPTRPPARARARPRPNPRRGPTPPRPPRRRPEDRSEHPLPPPRGRPHPRPRHRPRRRRKAPPRRPRRPSRRRRTRPATVRASCPSPSCGGGPIWRSSRDAGSGPCATTGNCCAGSGGTQTRRSGGAVWRSVPSRPGGSW